MAAAAKPQAGGEPASCCRPQRVQLAANGAGSGLTEGDEAGGELAGSSWQAAAGSLMVRPEQEINFWAMATKSSPSKLSSSGELSW